MVGFAQPAPGPKLYGGAFKPNPEDSNTATGAIPEEDPDQPSASTAPPSTQHGIDPSIVKFQQAAAAAAANGKSQAQILDELQKLQIQQLDEQAAAQAQPH